MDRFIAIAGPAPTMTAWNQRDFQIEQFLVNSCPRGYRLAQVVPMFGPFPVAIYIFEVAEAPHG